MWIELGRSLGLELEYLFASMAEAAMPDPLWQAKEQPSPANADSTPPAPH